MPLHGLFWNLGRRDCLQFLAAAILERKLDLVILVESDRNADQMIGELQAKTGLSLFCPESVTERIQVLGSRPDLVLEEVFVDGMGRLSMRRLVWNAREYLVAAAHLASKLHWSDAGQYAEAQMLASDIRSVEDRFGHRRTILCGDLNMNPFEPGVVQAGGLHAMLCRADVLREKHRTVQAREYPFFYNPMWGLLGDRSPGPPGSYFQRRTEHLSYDWNLFDQILFRPDVLEHVRETVEVLAAVGETSLIDRLGRPDSALGSDHLPLFFGLQETASDSL